MTLETNMASLRRAAIEADTTEHAFKRQHALGKRSTSIHPTLGRTVEGSRTFFNNTLDERKIALAVQELESKVDHLPETLITKTIAFLATNGFSADQIVEILQSIDSQDELGRLPGIVKKLSQRLKDAKEQADKLGYEGKQKENFVETAINVFFHKNEAAHGNIGYGTDEVLEEKNALKMTQTGMLREFASEMAKDKSLPPRVITGPRKLLTEQNLMGHYLAKEELTNTDFV